MSQPPSLVIGAAPGRAPSGAQARALGETLRAQGYVVLPGVLDPTILAAGRALYDELYEKQWALAAEHPDDWVLTVNQTAGGVQLRTHLSDDRVAAVPAAMALVEHVAAAAYDVLAAYVGEPLAVPIGFLTFRRHTVPNDPKAGYSYVGFHQDSNFLGVERAVNCWVCFDDCGVDAPGLELVASDLAEDLTGKLPGLVSTEGIQFPVYDEAALRQRFPASAFVKPALAVGDLLMFTGFTPHRTHMSPAMTRARASVEVRVFRWDVMPADMRAMTPVLLTRA
jgi:hypothetical protein